MNKLEATVKNFATDPHARMDETLKNIRRAAHALDLVPNEKKGYTQLLTEYMETT